MNEKQLAKKKTKNSPAKARCGACVYMLMCAMRTQ